MIPKVNKFLLYYEPENNYPFNEFLEWKSFKDFIIFYLLSTWSDIIITYLSYKKICINSND